MKAHTLNEEKLVLIEDVRLLNRMIADFKEQLSKLETECTALMQKLDEPN